MTREDWAVYVHTALDPLCDTTISFIGGLIRVESTTSTAGATYEIDDAEVNQTTANACIASIQAGLGL